MRINTMAVGLCLGITIISLFAGTSVSAAPALLVEFPEGSGTQELGVSSRVATSGPVLGPLAITAVADGMAVLDTVNSRVVNLDASGKLTGSVPLPDGTYKDLAVASSGTLWTINEENRAVIRIADGTGEKRCTIASGAGFPEQFDALAIDGDALVIGDFSTGALYWVSFDGNLLSVASWPTSLGIVASASGEIACLALGEDDRYENLIRIDRTGRVQSMKIEGECLDAARLIGFLPDGRPLGIGILTREPLARQVFAIDPTGLAVPLETIPHRDPLLLSTRPGTLAGSSVWINLSLLSGKTVIFGRFDLNP